jgi:hypothetical protein
MRYWSNLFTYDTWRRRDPRRASWGANRHKTAAELRPGDIVIAYVARIGWTGVYRATSRAELEPSGPFGDEYPLLADIERIVEVPLEGALTIADLPDDAPLRRWPAGPIYPNLVQSSGSELPPGPGGYLVETLTVWAKAPTRRQLSPRQTSHVPSARKRESSLGPVSIPDDTEAEADELPVVDPAPVVAREVTEHSILQANLLELGRLLGHTPWVTSGDQNRACRQDGTTLGDLPGVTTQLPRQFDDATTDTIRRIDVMWLHRNRIEAAFEVEHTTAIYSGILRMADLLALQPNLDIPLYVVVPDDRRNKALEEIGRPVFRQMTRPLPESCAVLTASSVEELLNDARRLRSSLKTDVLQHYADRAE